MTWFKVDDKLHDHKKARGISLAAAGLWVLSGSWCGDNRTDGFIPASVIRRWGATARHAKELVERALWEPAQHDGEAGYQFVGWSEWQPERDDTTTALGRARWARRQALLKNRKLCDDIVARDDSLCRYCGHRVDFSDRRGARGGTYDHVDPAGDNVLENVVVACRRCNGRKKDRTPDEAGMPLLDPRATAQPS